MANAVVTIKIMPESPEVDLKTLEKKAKEEIKKFTGESETKTEIEPVAFGLKAIKIIFVVDEKKGSPDPIAEKIAPRIMLLLKLTESTGHMYTIKQSKKAIKKPINKLAYNLPPNLFT